MPLSCLEDDLDAVFASSDFGEATGAVLNGDTANPIPGIFDDEDVEAQNGEGLTVLVPNTTFTCASSKVSGIDEGQTMVIRSVTYTVRYWEDDGAGTHTIHLEKPEA